MNIKNSNINSTKYQCIQINIRILPGCLGEEVVDSVGGKDVRFGGIVCIEVCIESTTFNFDMRLDKYGP